MSGEGTFGPERPADGRVLPLTRDPWAWASAASVLPLILCALGAPLGEPVAEDFDFLRSALLLRNHSWLDGGGSGAFWRPLAHQLYYRTLGPLALVQPNALAAIHVVLLTACAVLLYRAFRARMPGPWAAAAAGFPLLQESTRTLIAWPSHFVDLGSLLFAACALHEASRGRMITSLLALTASLLCKEVGVVAALLIPFLPGTKGKGNRLRWTLGCGAVALVWAVIYLFVREHAGLALPHDLEPGLRTLGVSPWARLQWAMQNSLRAIVSLPATHVSWEGPYRLAWAVFLVGLLLRLGTRPLARQRLRGQESWVAWGLVWFVLAAAALGTIHPLWSPNRALFGALGMGLAVVVLAGAAHPMLLVLLVVLRLVGFALSPGPPRSIAVAAPETGAFIDFERLVRLQRLMVSIRGALHARFPTLPPGSRVGQNFLPPRTAYALGGDHALQVWYRDTTLRWLTYEQYSRDSTLRLVTIVEFQPYGTRPGVALIDPATMQGLLRANRLIADQRWQEALTELGRAESLQSDPRAVAFIGTLASRKALCLLALGERQEAMREAHRALAISRYYFDARLVLANDAFEEGRLAEAVSRLDTLLRVLPGDSAALHLLERVRAAGSRPSQRAR